MIKRQKEIQGDLCKAINYHFNQVEPDLAPGDRLKEAYESYSHFKLFPFFLSVRRIKKEIHMS
jgi:hypothetical protein